MKEPRSYVLYALLAAAAAVRPIDLSLSGGPLLIRVWAGLLGLAVLWNLVQLGRRLQRLIGGKEVWHLLRTLLFWIIGLFNTALARPEHVGTWRTVIGGALLVIALLDTISLYRIENRLVSPERDLTSPPQPGEPA